MDRLTARTSTIFIATGDKTRVFRTISEVPPNLRRQLQETTQGMNSATILIADRRGREELVRALQGQPTDVQCRLANNLRSREGTPGKRRRLRVPSSLRIWLELLLPVAVGASLWLLIGSRF